MSQSVDAKIEQLSKKLRPRAQKARIKWTAEDVR